MPAQIDGDVPCVLDAVGVPVHVPAFASAAAAVEMKRARLATIAPRSGSKAAPMSSSSDAMTANE